MKKELNDLMELGNTYKEFITSCKTERECASYITARAEEAGFKKI